MGSRRRYSLVHYLMSSFQSQGCDIFPYNRMTPDGGTKLSNLIELLLGSVGNRHG